MNNTDVILEVLLKFTEPYLAVGETNHDNKAYNNLLEICYIHDYCYDLIRENAELKGNEASIVKAREKALDQELCEDAISREDALMCLTGEIKETDTIETIIARSVRRIRKLSSVKPQEPCEDAISRAYIEPIIEELENICVNSDEHILNLLADIKNAPPVNPQPNTDMLDKIRVEIESKCDRINSLASVLSYTAHREIQELLCEIMDLFEPQERSGKE